MYIEYQYNDIDLNLAEVKELLDGATTIGIDSILIDVNHIKLARNINHKCKINTYLDYPLGLCDLKLRGKILTSIVDTYDIDIISVVLPSHYLVNRKYDKIREEIKQNFDITKTVDPNINIRYILEYRRFDHSILAKICDILVHNNIYEIYPSTGLFIDDINDNIIASVFLTKKTGIKCILTGKVWTERQAKSIIDSGSYGVSLNTIHGINFFKNNDSIKQ